MFRHQIAGEAFQRLRAWVLAKCPAALKDPEFLPGLVVVEGEVETALRLNCWRHMRAICEPCRQ